ncbi:unnamed protein product [Amaranthus hypochondriacus]
MGSLSKCSEKMKLLIGLLSLQLCFAGYHIVSRVALNIGVSKVVYPIYRNIIALLILAPIAFFLERKERPRLTFSLLIEFFFLALLGVTANQGFYILGLYYASPTFASGMQNSVPAITFVLATMFGLEQVNIFSKQGVAKVLGTIASVGGASIITLYKGIPLLHQTVTEQSEGNSVAQLERIMGSPTNSAHNITWGCIFLLGHCVSWAGWMVYQASVLKKYPAKLSLTSYTCFFGLVQFLAIAAFTETDYEHWKITSGEEVLTILYAGIVASGLVISLQTWCIHKGGPVCVAVFQPVQTVLVAILAALFLGDQLYSGGVLGAITIALGLYLVLWGKTTEYKSIEQGGEDQLHKHLLQKTDNEESEDCVTSDIP